MEEFIEHMKKGIRNWNGIFHDELLKMWEKSMEGKYAA